MQRSLPLRTVLHHDGSLEAPFERLTAMYRESGRLAELVGLYRQHTTDYPADPNGAADMCDCWRPRAMFRLLATARAMSETHKTDAYLHYLYFQALQRGDSRRPWTCSNKPSP